MHVSVQKISILSLITAGCISFSCVVPSVEPDGGVAESGSPEDAAVLPDAQQDAGQADTASRDAARPDISYGLEAVGTDSRFEIATWNLQDFPRAGDATVSALTSVIHDLQLDLIAVEEITDMRQFQLLINSLPGYSGILTTDTYANGAYHKTGLIYRQGTIQVSGPQELFNTVDDEFAFPRSPMQAEIVATSPGGGAYRFTIIVLHLKAGTEDADYASRSQAIEKLKTHIDGLRVDNPGHDVVVLGDFNAKVFGHSGAALDPILDDNDYLVLTEAIADDGEWSLPAYQIFIDHIIATDEGASDFAGAQTQVLHLDELVQDYADLISDHRPVMTSISPQAW